MGCNRPSVDGRAFLAWLKAASRALGRHRKRIDALNVFPVPDGDTGTNLWMTLTASYRQARLALPGSLPAIGRAAAQGALVGARGNSGVIFSQLVAGFVQHVEEQGDPEELDGAGLARALKRAAEQAYRAVPEPVEGTMLTVAREAASAAMRRAEGGDAELREVLLAALAAAQRALWNTPSQLPQLAQAGVVDAGGLGLVLVLGCACGQDSQEAVGCGWGFAAGVAAGGTATAQLADGAGGPAIQPASLERPYCTEFVVQGEHIPLQRLRRRLAGLGDCVLVVGDSHQARCHLHTARPGRALEAALPFGQLLAVSVTNMQEQNRRAAGVRPRRPRPGADLQ